MSEPVVADLLARVEELERTGRVAPPAPRRRRPRRRYVGLAVAALTALLLVPVGVFASHQFTDVPNSNTFHASIGRVKDAGITAGCSPTQFCPNNEVTRGQMAAFLTRVAPRASTSWWPETELVDDSEMLLAQLAVKGAEGAGGTAAVVVNASVSVVTDDVAGCPCTGAFYIVSDSPGFGSWTQYATATDINISFEGDEGLEELAVGSTSLSVLLTIPSGVTENVYLIGWLDHGSAVFTYGEMVASVANFDGAGGNVQIPVTSGDRPGSGPSRQGSQR
jgi:S-layer homology domain